MLAQSVVSCIEIPTELATLSELQPDWNLVAESGARQSG